MTITRLQTNDRMSQCVIHNETVYLAGQVALSAPGESVENQTKAILNQIDQLLKNAGTDKSKALSATIWLCSMNDFAEMNKSYAEFFDEDKAPARSTVQVARLPLDADVEIEVMASLD